MVGMGSRGNPLAFSLGEVGSGRFLTQNRRMETDSRERANDGLELLLKAAHAALDCGDVRAGRETSQKVLKAAEGLGNRHYEAKALLCLAHCDRMLSRYRRAHRASQRAAHLFQLLGDTSGEVMALTTHAFVSVNLGRNEEAVEAALLSVRLSQFLDKDEHSVLSFNALGVAYFWSHSFEKAEQALHTAIQIAERAKPRLSTFQPRVNQWWTEVIRVFFERYYVGELPSLDPLRTLRETIISLLAGGDEGSVGLGTHVTTEAVLLFGLSLDQCWHGRIGQAKLDVEALASWARRYGTVTWLSALESWVRAEIAWAQADWPLAMEHAARMISVAVDVEHEQLACLGHLLSSQLYVAQGKNGEALDEVRRLRLREQLIRSDSLETREKVASGRVHVWAGREIPAAVLRDREVLAEEGFASCAVMLDIAGSVVDVSLLTRGVIDEIANESEVDDARTAVRLAIAELDSHADDARVAEQARLAVRRTFFKSRGKKPMTVVHVRRTPA